MFSFLAVEAALHSPCIAADEDGIAVGVRVVSAVLLDRLEWLRSSAELALPSNK
jgi:hypothetical protein